MFLLQYLIFFSLKKIIFRKKYFMFLEITMSYILPLFPQGVPQEFLTIQYLVDPETPYPTA